MPEIAKGSTDITRYVVLRDSTTGAPSTGLTITNLDLQYTRFGAAAATKVDATALSTAADAHSDNKAIEVDATSSPGLYRIDWPDAAFASGVNGVILVVSATGVDPAIEEITLTNFNPYDGVRAGLTALPNAAADGAGGLPISDAGGLDLDAKIGALTFTVAGDVDCNIQSIGGSALSTSSAQLGVNVVNAGGQAVTLSSGNKLQVDVFSIDESEAATQLQSLACNTMIAGTVDNTAFTATDSIFESDDITESEGNQFLGKTVVWTSGTLIRQSARITAYSLNSGRGRFTVRTMSGNPANNDTFIVL